MKIGDRVIQKHTGLIGTVVTDIERILDVDQVGVKFDNPLYNDLFDPYYCAIETLELLYEN